MEATAFASTTESAPLRVGGVVPFSTADWPGKLAAVVFTQGCAWRCAYCHNPHLRDPEAPDTRDWAGVLDWLGTRKHLLEAVVFSGGEPTSQPGLGDAMAAVRQLGFAVGLHTAGIYPRKLTELLRHVDWVGFDVKAPREDYERVTGVRRSGLGVYVALAMIQQAGLPFEVRTTVHYALTPPDVLEKMAGELAAAGVRDWVLQPFRPQGCADDELKAAAPQGTVIADALVARLRAQVPGVVVR